MGEPTYRGIYTYDDANKPANPPKSSPMYRGIYAYNAANKPSEEAPEPESIELNDEGAVEDEEGVVEDGEEFVEDDEEGAA